MNLFKKLYLWASDCDGTCNKCYGKLKRICDENKGGFPKPVRLVNGKMRYFIVFFRTPDRVGISNMMTHDGSYLNKNRTIELIEFDNVVITNIIELAKQDYESWIRN